MRFRSLCVVVLILGISGCARNFVTKERQFKLISEKTEIEIGKKAKAQIIKEYGQYHDLDWQIYLDQVGQKLVAASDRPKLPYDFTVLDTDVLNAFAVPGGFVFMTRGILMEMADEAELAIVLGHEITHVAAWHGVEMLQKAGLLATLTTLGAIGGIAMGAGEAAIVLAQAASVYENLYLLGYGRKNELEADRFGILYAARAGYDPEASLTFFKRLGEIEKEEEAGQRISPYWRTHPLTVERLKRASKWIAQIPQKSSATAYNRDKYQSMVARLPQMEPAERGVVKDLTYRNKPFKLALDVPAGWRLDNTRSQTMVNFYGPDPAVKGNLQRMKIPPDTGVEDFGKQIAKQWGIPPGAVTSRNADYPAGHGLLWQYGGNFLRYRSLLVIRDGSGYIVTCQMPSDTYLQYIVDCEKIMRSFQIQ